MAEEERFPNAGLLWRPEELASRLEEQSLVVLDLRPAHELMSGVIPGAVHLDLYGLGHTHTGAECFEEFINMMRSLFALRGINRERRVVLCEENSGMRAARAFWLLEYMGHRDVHLLDGGLGAWRRAGRPLMREMAAPRSISFSIEPNRDIFISADALLGRLSDPGTLPLDTRGEKEWLGRNTRGGPRGGTIPGAVHLEWSRALDETGAFKSPAALKELFEGAGVTPDRSIVPFCQGGYRSSHTYLALRLLGYRKIENFVGSWKEWGERLELPIEVPPQ